MTTDDDRVRALLIALDGVARDCDHYEYGLPLYTGPAYDAMAGAVADALRAAVAAERGRCLGSLEEARDIIIGHANATRDLGALDALEMAEKLIREGT